ncbi:GldG family protein [Calothrix rhizosoleniae]|uniref:GldG family protein n=1 Tax=Calothrix rhizosoleniae TaxID=888997 RepID=UPI001F3BBD34|nr:Gldg family protein [Calothrix rhizosoleniae]
MQSLNPYQSVIQKIGKYWFWLSPFLITAGLTVGFFSEKWDIVPLILIVTGVAIAIIWTLWQSKRSNWWGKRSTQVGTNAIIATSSAIVILGLINFLGTRYSVRQDLTETQLFTLAPQSQELVRSLKSPVKVWVFDVTQNPQERELLENYQRYNSKFKFAYVDPQAKPGLVKKFGVDENNGKVYLESGKQRIKVTNVNERLSEVRLTNRLQQISSATTLKVYFLQGHGEHPLNRGNNAMSQAVQALADKNYVAEPLTLTDKSEVPNDAAVVIIAGATQDLFANEVKTLQNYLNSGGNLLLMVDPGTDPKLAPLLKEWGVTLDPRLAVDVSGNAALGPAIPLVTTYGQHPITKNFGNNISFYQLARPIETKPVKGVQANPLLLTKPYPSSWAESDLQSENLEFDEKSDRKGPLTLGVALTRKVVEKSPAPKPQSSPSPTTSPTATTQTSPSPTTKPTTSPTPTAQASPSPTTSPTPTAQPSPSPTPTNNQAKISDRETRLVVIGNSRFATNTWFQRALNGDVFLNSVTWLSQQDTQPLSIRPKSAKNRRINLNSAQASLLTISSLIVLPLIGIIGAIALWLKRR